MPLMCEIAGVVMQYVCVVSVSQSSVCLCLGGVCKCLLTIPSSVEPWNNSRHGSAFPDRHGRWSSNCWPNTACACESPDLIRQRSLEHFGALLHLISPISLFSNSHDLPTIILPAHLVSIAVFFLYLQTINLHNILYMSI